MLNDYKTNLLITYMNNKIIENLEQLKKMLVLLSEDRKVVLSHHKTFEHVEKMRKIVNESIDMANQ
jgi:predicted metal-dependent peptidase